jgi:hypothetical protein
VWGAFLADLFRWFLIFGFAAVVVAAAAYAGVRQVDPGAPFRRLGAIIMRTPARPLPRLARAAAILAVSLLLLLRPEAGLSIIMVAVGGWGMFIAATEIMLVIAPPPEAITDRPSERVAGLVRRVRWRRVGAFLGAVAVIVVLAVVFVFGGDERPAVRPPGPVAACNGHEELCDRTLDQVAFPATHNSMSASREPGWFTTNQRNGITRQLDDGIRALLIDTHYGVPSSGSTVITDLSREDATRGEIEQELGEDSVERVERLVGGFAFEGVPGEAEPYLCHVVCELGATELTEALTGVREFLDTHPDEFVVLFIEDVVSPKDVAPAFEESGILRYAYVHKRAAPFPTMRELIEADERLFVLGESQSGGAEFPWYHDGFELVQETPYTFHSPKELAKAASCNPNRGTPDSPTFQINNWVEKIPRDPDLAREVNEYDTLLERARLCEKRRGLLPNIIAVDFYDQGDLFGVANELNGLDRDAEATVRTIP